MKSPYELVFQSRSGRAKRKKGTVPISLNREVEIGLISTFVRHLCFHLVAGPEFTVQRFPAAMPVDDLPCDLESKAGAEGFCREARAHNRIL